MGEFDDDSKAAIWNRVLTQALALPGVKVDRESFLKEQLARRCDDAQMEAAIADRPANAGIPSSAIDELANGSIKLHTLKAASLSFAAGVPGLPLAPVTITADAIQFYWHILVLQQKLAYLYGWPDLTSVDDETRAYFTLFTGVMFGVDQANKLIQKVAEESAKVVAKKVPRMALTKTAWYPVIKKVAMWLGIKMTKPLLGKLLAKGIPVIGGVASASITAVAMPRMAKKLTKHLRKLPQAKPDTLSRQLVESRT